MQADNLAYYTSNKDYLIMRAEENFDYRRTSCPGNGNLF